MGCGASKVSEVPSAAKSLDPIAQAPVPKQQEVNIVKQQEEQAEAEKLKSRAPRVRRGSVSAEADKGGADANFVPPVIPKSKEHQIEFTEQ